MYCTDTGSRFNYYDNTKKVVILASLETLGDHIYLDYGSKKVAERVIGRLIDCGYQKDK